MSKSLNHTFPKRHLHLGSFTSQPSINGCFSALNTLNFDPVESLLPTFAFAAAGTRCTSSGEFAVTCHLSIFKESFMFKKSLTILLALYTALSFAAVDVNSASGADLDSIKGIGPGTSQKILEARKVSKFKDWNDLIQRVTGIGDKRAAKLSQEGLTVNGAGFKTTSAAPVGNKTAPVVNTKPAQK
jgi:competence protein ComEA